MRRVSHCVTRKVALELCIPADRMIRITATPGQSLTSLFKRAGAVACVKANIDEG